MCSARKSCICIWLAAMWYRPGYKSPSAMMKCIQIFMYWKANWVLMCQWLRVRSLWKCQWLGFRSPWNINNSQSGCSEYVNNLTSDMTPTQTKVAQEPPPTQTFQTCNISTSLQGVTGLSHSLTQTDSDLTCQTQTPVIDTHLTGANCLWGS